MSWRHVFYTMTSSSVRTSRDITTSGALHQRGCIQALCCIPSNHGNKILVGSGGRAVRMRWAECVWLHMMWQWYLSPPSERERRWWHFWRNFPHSLSEIHPSPPTCADYNPAFRWLRQVMWCQSRPAGKQITEILCVCQPLPVWCISNRHQNVLVMSEMISG